uniref:Uncharacterized protein n=1 Tax=Macaca fascicularis TaxID=9541 RepID=A0A7N9CCQ9_MACFA
MQPPPPGFKPFPALLFPHYLQWESKVSNSSCSPTHFLPVYFFSFSRGLLISDNKR